MDRKTAAEHLRLVLGSAGSSDRLDFRPSSSRQNSNRPKRYVSFALAAHSSEGGQQFQAIVNGPV